MIGMDSTGTTVTVGVEPLTFDEVVEVARNDAPVALAEQALAEIDRSRAVIDGLVDDTRPHYGVSTGFGALALRQIPAERRGQLQRSLIHSHAAGTGAEVEREVVRALMLLRLSTLATGRTGVRRETATAYAAMLSAGITPIVHEHGSLGCSGDLAPLAHCALALMGEGPVRDAEGRACAAAAALAAAGIEPAVLAEKEGLALINGTDGMLGMLVLAIADLRLLLSTADVVAAMSVEGLLGTDAVFAADLTAAPACEQMVRTAVDTFGGLHILVNNIGLAAVGTVVDVSEEDWDRSLDINLRTAFLASKYAVPAMIEAGGGSIVNISSISALRGDGTVAYSAAKGGLLAMTVDMAYSHGRQGIRVNAIAPGHITTPMVLSVSAPGPRAEFMNTMRSEAGLLGSPGDGWDVAWAATFLASDEARWITGVTLPVESGVLSVTPLLMAPHLRAVPEPAPEPVAGSAVFEPPAPESSH